MYAHINGEFLEKTKNKANEASKEDDENSKDFKWEELPDKVISEEVEDGVLKLDLENELGFFSIDYTLNMDIAIDIIEFYMKKLGKLKTILEASK